MKLKLVILAALIILGVEISYAKNTALLVGIGNYNTNTTGWSVIHGNNDVALLEKKLKSKHYSMTKIIDNKATKTNITTALAKLVAMTQDGDNIYLHFSGHGQLIQDMNGDEQSDLDQSFVCYDACFSPKYKLHGAAYRGQNHLVDDELFPYLNDLKRKVGKSGRVMVVFDTCYSGGADRGNIAEEPDPGSEVEWTETVRGTDDEFQVNASAEAYLRRIKKPGAYVTAGGTLTVISACESDQRNYECKEKHSGRKYGSLSFYISKLLESNVPMSQWSNYFKNKKYQILRIFRSSQHPVVETH